MKTWTQDSSWYFPHDFNYLVYDNKNGSSTADKPKNVANNVNNGKVHLTLWDIDIELLYNHQKGYYSVYGKKRGAKEGDFIGILFRTNVKDGIMLTVAVAGHPTYRNVGVAVKSPKDKDKKLYSMKKALKRMARAHKNGKELIAPEQRWISRKEIKAAVNAVLYRHK